MFDNEVTKEQKVQESVKNFLNGLVEDKKKEIKMMHERGSILLEKVYTHLRKEGVVDFENLLYFPEKYDFTEEELHYLFTNITYFLEEVYGVVEASKDVFPTKTCFLEYGGTVLEFLTMYGQGVATIISLVDDESLKDVPKDKIGSFDKWLNKVKQDYENIDTVADNITF